MSEASPDLSGPSPPHAGEWTLDFVVAYCAIVVMALIPIYIGSWLSVFRKSEPRKENEEAEEIMTSKDAYMFPVMGSAVLVSLYLLFRFLDKNFVNLLLTVYFLVIGFIALAQTFGPILLKLFPFLQSNDRVIKLWVPWDGEDTEIVYNNSLIAGAILSAAILAWYASAKSWIANNVIGLSFCVQGISMINLGSYKVGAILLGGLFFYDIWWVFFTDVMVTVAKNFDAPIKFLFPKNFITALTTGEPFQFSLLGLGDAVIPGVFIALMLRYDLFKFNIARKAKSLTELPNSFPTSYFHVTFIAYAVGLVTTIVVMHTFQAAQPALLYLVPACLGATFIFAMVSGDLGNLLTFDEAAAEGAVSEKKNK